MMRAFPGKSIWVGWNGTEFFSLWCWGSESFSFFGPGGEAYEVCPKSSWTSLVEVIDKHISLKAFTFHEVQHQLNKWSKFHENCFSLFGVTLS